MQGRALKATVSARSNVHLEGVHYQHSNSVCGLLPVFKAYFALYFPPYCSADSTEVSEVKVRNEAM
jgi:hypothetical protein